MFLLIVFGSWGSKAISIAYSEGAFVSWRFMGKPPSDVIRFIAGNPRTLWLELRDGNIYKLDTIECENPEEGCYRLANDCNNPEDECYQASYDSSIIHFETAPKCQSKFKQMKSPSTEVVECLSVFELDVVGYGEHHYVLLEDHSVWSWNHNVTGGVGPEGIFGFYNIPVCCGAILGTLIGLLIILQMQKQIKKTVSEVN